MHRSKTVTLSVVPVVAAAFLAGCGDDDASETAYCVDENEMVVENYQCDDDYNTGGGGGFFFFYAASSLGRGQSIRGLQGDRVRTTDRATLARRGGLGGASSNSGGVGRPTSSGGSGFSGGG